MCVCVCVVGVCVCVYLCVCVCESPPTLSATALVKDWMVWCLLLQCVYLCVCETIIVSCRLPVRTGFLWSLKVFDSLEKPLCHFQSLESMQ